MDQSIIQIRRNKFLAFKKETWLPHITKKYQSFFTNYTIYKYIKHYLLFNVENSISKIPGIYRKRLRLKGDPILNKETLSQFDLDLHDFLLNINVCIDLRIFGPDPTQPFYHENIIFYLDYSQQQQIIKHWNKVNPHTTTGHLFRQTLDYIKSF